MQTRVVRLKKVQTAGDSPNCSAPLHVHTVPVAYVRNAAPVHSVLAQTVAFEEDSRKEPLSLEGFYKKKVHSRVFTNKCELSKALDPKNSGNKTSNPTPFIDGHSVKLISQASKSGDESVSRGACLNEAEVSKEESLVITCNVCGKTAQGRNRKQNMENHMMTHNGLRPHKCFLCNYSSTQAGNLRRHIKKMHESNLCNELLSGTQIDLNSSAIDRQAEIASVELQSVDLFDDQFSMNNESPVEDG